MTQSIDLCFDFGSPKTFFPSNTHMLMRGAYTAKEPGAFGLPNFYVGEELFFGKDRRREVEEAYVAPHGT